MQRAIKMQTKKVSLASLPIAPATRLLTRNLTADPIAKDPANFHKLLYDAPSLQRRARLLDSSSHFSYVTPLPLPFPFNIQFPEDVQDKKQFIESWLSVKEATEVIDSATEPSNQEGMTLTKYTSEARIQERELLGVATSCVQELFPQLDIGDSLDVIGRPSLLAKEEKVDSHDKEAQQRVPSESDTKARQELLDILSGHTVLASFPSDSSDSTTGYAPWSLRYSGHQFGQWAGQLGDGRAISILEVHNPDSPSDLYEIQLKGAGRTPFSRSADGLAVVRSSIREYLCAEAMHALGIPTTRSLALTYLPTLHVIRERVEKAAILSRVAPSFIRIGSFQALNPPQQMFFLGGGQQPADLDALRILGEYVSKNVLKLDMDGSPWAKRLVMEVAKRNALMVAGWQAYGFMHGVINTDNVSIMGLTIDYGPYAFMDLYDSSHICNHSDDEGRYSFKLQPTMIVFALKSLLSALAPIIGAEAQKQAAFSSDWLEEGSETVVEWTKSGLKIQGELEKMIIDIFKKEYTSLMRKRLGLLVQDEDDYSQIITPFLGVLERNSLDISSTFRSLAKFRPEMLEGTHVEELDNLIGEIHAFSQCNKPGSDGNTNKDSWAQWLSAYAARIKQEEEEWKKLAKNDQWHDIRRDSMRKSNPRFILRQWVLEEVIAKVEQDHTSGRRVLAKTLEMASKPFEGWGGEDVEEGSLTNEQREERRFCSLGDDTMLGFQCSCSS